MVYKIKKAYNVFYLLYIDCFFISNTHDFFLFLILSILFSQAQLTRIGLNLAPGVEPQTVVFAALYDIKMNTTTVPENRRDQMPMSPTDPVYIITNMLKRFAEYNPNPSKYIFILNWF